MSSMRPWRMMVEKRKMIAVTAMAPTKAAPTTAIKPVQEKSAVLTLPPQSSMTRATPRLAPLLMPKTSGPARGLRKAVCSIRPLAASDAPQSVAVRAWGRRVSRTIYCQLNFALVSPRRIRATSWQGILTGPMRRERAKRRVASSARINPMIIPLAIWR